MAADNIEHLKQTLPPILDAVPNLKRKTANEYAGPCPWCGGNDRFVVFLDSGRFMCRHCSPNGGDVIDYYCKAEGLDIKGLAVKYLSPEPIKQTETGRYFYHDETGKVLYCKVRFEPGKTKDKDFYFYHNNQTGRGCEPVLYNLPAVLSSDTVYITEGEKHADLLNSWGLCGTTLDTGNLSKIEKTPNAIKQLTGKSIIILPDNDYPGRVYRDMIVSGLQGKAASIKVVDLPGLPEKGDVIDWAEAGHGKDELLDLVNSAPVWTPVAVADCTLNAQPDGDDFIIKQWPTLSAKALYGLAGVAVELATRYSEADPAAVLFQFLAFFGAKCGAGVKFFVGDTIHYPRLNVAIIGNSSKARKGTSAQPVKKFFKSETDVIRVSPGPLSSGEGIIDAVRDETREYQLNKGLGVYEWVVTDPGIDDKRLIILDEELASALASMKRDGNKLSTIIRGMWDSGTCAPLTKTAKTKCTDAHVIMCTHSTFSELKAKLEDNEYVNGFGNRFLWVMARRQKLVSRPLPMQEDEVEAVRTTIERAYNGSKDMQRLYFSNDTWSLWDTVYPSLTKDHPGYAGAIINRGEAQVIRLSMIYALIDSSDVICPVHLEAALAAWDYCKASALYIFGDREEDSLTQKIIDILKEGKKTATDISNALNRNIKSKAIKSCLDDLIARGRVVTEQEETKGRTKTIFSLNEYEINEISPNPLTLNSLNSFNSSSYEINRGGYVEL